MPSSSRLALCSLCPLVSPVPSAILNYISRNSIQRCTAVRRTLFSCFFCSCIRRNIRSHVCLCIYIAKDEINTYNRVARSSQPSHEFARHSMEWFTHTGSFNKLETRSIDGNCKKHSPEKEGPNISTRQKLLCHCATTTVRVRHRSRTCAPYRHASGNVILYKSHRSVRRYTRCCLIYAPRSLRKT